MRRIAILLWLVVAVVLIALGTALVTGLLRDGSTFQAGTAQPEAPLGGAFSLVDQNGDEVSEAVFREKPSAVFFGFTHCPDVCPTTLMETTEWIEALGPEAEEMRFVFVTVDPARDTPEILNEYLSAFSDRIIGITGDPEKVEAMVRDYKVYAAKVPLEDGGYTMDHTASVLLLDEEARLVGTISRQEGRETALAKLRQLVAG